MKKPYFGRLLTAMVTPFDESGVNVEAVKKLVDWWLAHGTDGLVVTGSTGEAATMSVEEKKLLWTTVVQYVNGRVPVIAGTGSNSTAGSIEMTKLAESCGVDGVLIVGPYYNKPTQEGYYRHFKAIADSIEISDKAENAKRNTRRMGKMEREAAIERLTREMKEAAKYTNPFDKI